MAVLKPQIGADGRVELNAEELRQKILLETARLEWPELARYFARGLVVIAAADVDLVEAAACLAENDVEKLRAWTDSGLVRRALDADAKRWDAETQSFWAVVVAPWVLVQEMETAQPDQE